jgi:hypothetical protein
MVSASVHRFSEEQLGFASMTCAMRERLCAPAKRELAKRK